MDNELCLYSSQLHLALNLIGFCLVVSGLIKSKSVEIVFVLKHPYHKAFLFIMRVVLFAIVFMTNFAAMFVIPLAYWIVSSGSLSLGYSKCLEWMELKLTLWSLCFTKHLAQYVIGIRLKSFSLTPREIRRSFPRHLEYLAVGLLDTHAKHYVPINPK